MKLRKPHFLKGSSTVNDVLTTLADGTVGWAGPPGTDPEVVRDTMAAALVAGANVTITPDDAANTITIAAPGVSSGSSSSGRVLLKTVVLSAAAASIDFTSADVPPSGYTSLLIEAQLRTSNAVASDLAVAYLNGDTTDANYAQRFWYGSATATGLETQNRPAVAYIPGSTAAANKPGHVRLLIPNYLDTTWHKLLAADFNHPSPLQGKAQAYWNNAAAITSLSLVARNTSGVAQNFVAGCSARLYGLS